VPGSRTGAVLIRFELGKGAELREVKGAVSQSSSRLFARRLRPAPSLSISLLKRVAACRRYEIATFKVNARTLAPGILV